MAGSPVPTKTKLLHHFVDHRTCRRVCARYSTARKYEVKITGDCDSPQLLPSRGSGTSPKASGLTGHEQPGRDGGGGRARAQSSDSRAAAAPGPAPLSDRHAGRPAPVWSVVV